MQKFCQPCTDPRDKSGNLEVEEEVLELDTDDLDDLDIFEPGDDDEDDY